MSRYKAYPEYKDSEVEWLGKVPVQWELTRVKYVSELTPKKPILDRSLECSFIPMEKLKTDSIMLDESRVVDDVCDGYTYFQDDDILMAKVTPCFENKNIAVAKSLVNGIGFGSSEIYVIRTKKDVCNRYWFYRFQEDSFMDVATAAMTGAGGLKRVPSDVVTNFTAALPSFNEQQKIANFLDHETAKIDTLIAKQQELIKLLKEKRQAVISHAVTKGLNPNAPMRDSGVEWLGEVPVHWNTLNKLKNISTMKGRLGWQGLKAEEYIDEGPFVVSSAHFNNYQIHWEQCPHVSKERYELDNNIQLSVGDILLMKDGAAMGKLAYVDFLPDLACLNSHLLLLRTKTLAKAPCYDPKFMFYFMQTELFQSYVRVNGTGSIFLGISQQSVGNYRIVLPPYEEQLEIVNSLDRRIKSIEAMIEEANLLVGLMQERRTALISAAVTGKIDVRDWQPPSEAAFAA